MPRRPGRFAKPPVTLAHFGIEPADDPHAQTLHWPEYAIEAVCLGTFMVSAAGFAALLQHPRSPARRLDDVAATPARSRWALAMGLTPVAIIYSPAGASVPAHT